MDSSVAEGKGVTSIEDKIQALDDYLQQDLVAKLEIGELIMDNTYIQAKIDARRLQLLNGCLNN